ncbi:MAG: patatin-like phospholipase family protein [Pseudonocardiaceae bacterium]
MPRDVERSLAMFGNPGMYGLNPALLMAPWACKSSYETGPLRRTLAELADLDKLNHGGTRVIVGAIDVETALIKYFDNAGHDLTFDAVVASGSLPPGFPMTQIGGRWYWDGGLFANTPLSPAINFLESCEPDNPAIHQQRNSPAAPPQLVFSKYRRGTATSISCSCASVTPASRRAGTTVAGMCR